jgi:hypothetical protein
VIPSTYLQFLKGPPERTSRIEDVHRGPAVATVADIGRKVVLHAHWVRV